MICIYKITSPTNRVYIGQTWNWEKRKNSYVNSDCKSQRKLYNSLKKYGFEAHKTEILKVFSEDVSQETLDFWEIYYWKYYKDLGCKMLNIREPGSRGKNSEESKRRMSETRKGRKISEGTRQAFIKYNTGRVKSEEEQRKITMAHKGKVISLELRQRISNKLKLANLGGDKCKFSKKVLDTSSGTIYCSAREASKFTNMNEAMLRNRLNGRVKNNTILVYLENATREEVFS